MPNLKQWVKYVTCVSHDELSIFLVRKINKICTTWQLSTERKFAIFNTLWLHVFSSPGLDFGICADGKLHYTKSKTSSLMPQGRSKWEVALGRVSPPHRAHPFWGQRWVRSVRLQPRRCFTVFQVHLKWSLWTGPGLRPGWWNSYLDPSTSSASSPQRASRKANPSREPSPQVVL